MPPAERRSRQDVLPGVLVAPPAKRPHVWALYGFARYADEFVDSFTDPDPDALLRWGADFLDALGPVASGRTIRPHWR